MQIYFQIIFFLRVKSCLVLLTIIFLANDFYAFEIAVCLNALCFEGEK